VCVVGELVADRAEHERTEVAHPVRAGQDQAGVDLLGGVENRLPRLLRGEDGARLRLEPDFGSQANAFLGGSCDRALCGGIRRDGRSA
jgi:hypothetical protein